MKAVWLAGLFALLGGLAPPAANAQTARECPCSTSTSWIQMAKGLGVGEHYLYNFQSSSLRKFQVYLDTGAPPTPTGTVSQEATGDTAAQARPSLVIQARNLAVKQVPVESYLLADWDDWVAAYQLTSGTMKSTVTFDLRAGPTPIGFPDSVANGNIYDFASSTGRQNDLTDWVRDMGANGWDLPEAAVQALLKLFGNALQLDKASNVTIFITFVLKDGSKITLKWSKGDLKPRIEELIDANNQTVPRSQGQVVGNYDFSRHPEELDQFLNYVQQMGVTVQDVQSGGVWGVACVVTQGAVVCQRYRKY